MAAFHGQNTDIIQSEGPFQASGRFQLITAKIHGIMLVNPKELRDAEIKAFSANRTTVLAEETLTEL
jgi:hypothetical protein